MTTNEKCILITIFLAILAAIIFTLTYSDEIDGNEKLRTVIKEQVRC